MRVVFVGLFGLFVVGCFNSRYYQVRGRVVDCESRHGVRAAEVTVALTQQGDKPSGQRVTTDAAGVFRVYVDAWPDGQVGYLRVTKPGYIETEEEITSAHRRDQRICVAAVPGT